jgi:hypothetical protein
MWHLAAHDSGHVGIHVVASPLSGVAARVKTYSAIRGLNARLPKITSLRRGKILGQRILNDLVIKKLGILGKEDVGDGITHIACDGLSENRLWPGR